MADISEHVALAAPKLKEIAAEQEANDALIKSLVESDAKLVILRGEMSVIESDAASAGFQVSELHAECKHFDEDAPVIPLSNPVAAPPTAEEPAPAPSEPVAKEPAPEAPVPDEATNI